jgi:prepilin-type processing-associated H-X9-DG protein
VTLVELLVALGAIGILAAIALPAVQHSRESARQATCLNNLRQLGAATAAHVAAKGHYPPCHPRLAGFDAHGTAIHKHPSVSAHVHLLPYLDQEPLYAQVDRRTILLVTVGDPPDPAHLGTTAVDVFLCPSDGQPHGRVNYRACAGAAPMWIGDSGPANPYEQRSASGVFVVHRRTTPADVLDGTATTALFSERVVGDGDASHWTPWRDSFFCGQTIASIADAETHCATVPSDPPDHDSFLGCNWALGGMRQAAYNHVLAPNSPTPDCTIVLHGEDGGWGACTARSLHPGGVHVLLADGSARFIDDGVDLEVWRALSTRNGRQFEPPEEPIDDETF